jgi:8-oxo-dGTP pyrophosphatase MutT (NUDIX family)
VSIAFERYDIGQGMRYLYDETLKQQIVGRCGAFMPLPLAEAKDSLKLAAVAITLVAADDGSGRAALLLTRRARSLRSHRGQWALPGGRCDAGESPASAALRELNEELGLVLHEGDLLGVLDDYPTRSGYLIKPVVLWSRENAELRPNPLEVASVHCVPLDDISQPDAVDFVSIPESDRLVIRLRVEDRYVHAPTAAVIYQFLEVLAGRNTRVFDLEQPVFAWK